ncbi:sulfur carrier protein ThiS [Mucilaginibacter sp. SP1R1]|uniref:sulfur carrier protein ThiS n=1 Tax=Mucilaginibacter sp. SP1R1 TaxID=2723091 RepID=UPI00160C1329|nr:sulfur carrier protein ThiS [Mucilaginibacter sp. SP1R1]MBB6149909.1 sulfur carrier protein [Mucilaginibacter sp. SP1R1]
MDITVNQQHYTVPEGCTVQSLLADVLNQSPKGLAIAVNQTIVSKADWEQELLNHGDHIIIITATQGG